MSFLHKKLIIGATLLLTILSSHGTLGRPDYSIQTASARNPQISNSENSLDGGATYYDDYEFYNDLAKLSDQLRKWFYKPETPDEQINIAMSRQNPEKRIATFPFRPVNSQYKNRGEKKGRSFRDTTYMSVCNFKMCNMGG